MSKKIKDKEEVADDIRHLEYLSSGESVREFHQLVDAIDKALAQVIPLVCRRYDVDEPEFRFVLAQMLSAASHATEKDIHNRDEDESFN